MAHAHIWSGMLVLKQAQDYWASSEWTFRLFEWVIARKNLLAPTPAEASCPPRALFADLARGDTCPGGKTVEDTEGGTLDMVPDDMDPSVWFDDQLGFDFTNSLDLPWTDI